MPELVLEVLALVVLVKTAPMARTAAECNRDPKVKAAAVAVVVTDAAIAVAVAAVAAAVAVVKL